MRQKSQDSPAKEPQHAAAIRNRHRPCPLSKPARNRRRPPHQSLGESDPARGHFGRPSTSIRLRLPTGRSLKQLSGAELEQFLIDFVVEQTGYPPEMVEMDADLEADLGIDSIKKAQLFGELAEQFEISVDVSDESLSLDDFPDARACDAVSGIGERRAAKRRAESRTERTGAANPARPNGNRGIRIANGNGGLSSRAPRRNSAPQPVRSAMWTWNRFSSISWSSKPAIRRRWWSWMPTSKPTWASTASRKPNSSANWPSSLPSRSMSADENLSLDDFPTLRHVMEFLQSASGGFRPRPKRRPPAMESTPQTRLLRLR